MSNAKKESKRACTIHCKVLRITLQLAFLWYCCLLINNDNATLFFRSMWLRGSKIRSLWFMIVKGMTWNDETDQWNLMLHVFASQQFASYFYSLILEKCCRFVFRLLDVLQHHIGTWNLLLFYMLVLFHILIYTQLRLLITKRIYPIWARSRLVKIMCETLKSIWWWLSRRAFGF